MKTQPDERSSIGLTPENMENLKDTQIAYGEVDVYDPQTQIQASIKILPNDWMRDPHICAAADGCYYLTGTTRSVIPNEGQAGVWNDGIRVWRSRDLKIWEALGLVWSMDRDGTWQRWYQIPDGQEMRFVAPEDFCPDQIGSDVAVRRALWAPEIHWVRSLETFVLVASMNYSAGLPYDQEKSPYLVGGCFALRSVTGRAEGPYVATSAGPLCDLIDPCLFEDDDGSLYLIGLNNHLMRLKPDLSGVDGDYPRRHAQVSPDPNDTVEYVSLWDVPKLPQTVFTPEMWCEGGYLVKQGGRYHLCLSTSPRLASRGKLATYAINDPVAGEDVRGPYNVVVASSDHVWGPYGPRYTSITHGGHGNFFRDHEGRWWACVFNTPRSLGQPWFTPPECMAAIVPMRWENDRIHPCATISL